MKVGRTIYVAYLNGYVPPWADALEQGVADEFTCPVRGLEVELDLAAAFTAERQQHHATLLLAALLRSLPDPAAKIVGFTQIDLFIPVLTFVFGQSQLSGSGALVSTHRLHTEYYGLPPDEGLLLERAIKEAVHELGHAFGLVHCTDYRCVMHAATYVEDVDLKEAAFCPGCRGFLA